LARTIPETPHRWGIPFLTTGTFNLVVKDRIAFPPERRVSVHANPPLGRIRVSSKPFKNIVLLTACQSGVFTGFPHGGTTRSQALPAFLLRSKTHLPSRSSADSHLGTKTYFRHEPRRKIIWLRKDPMEVLAIKQKPHKPFEELCPRIWGLVAEANSSF
jgi:hypothetical protein